MQVGSLERGPKLHEQLLWFDYVANNAINTPPSDKEIDKSLAAQLMNANNNSLFVQNISAQYGHGLECVQPVGDITEVLTESLDNFISSPEFGM